MLENTIAQKKRLFGHDVYTIEAVITGTGKAGTLVYVSGTGFTTTAATGALVGVLAEEVTTTGATAKVAVRGTVYTEGVIAVNTSATVFGLVTANTHINFVDATLQLLNVAEDTTTDSGSSSSGGSSDSGTSTASVASTTSASK